MARIYFEVIFRYKHYFVRNFRLAPDKVSLSCDRHKSSDVSIHRHRLVTVCVPEDDVGDPDFTNLLQYLLCRYLLNCYFANLR